MHEKRYLKENMVGTTIAKGRIPDIRTYTKGIINLREALMLRSTSCPWAWTQSSRSTPTYSMHNLSFIALLKMIWVRRPTWWITRGVWPVKTFEFTQIKEGIGSTQRGFLEHIPWTSGVNNTSSKVEHGWQGRGYNLPKALCIREKGSQVYWIWRALSDKIQQRIRWSTRDLMWASVLNHQKKECKDNRL